MVQAREAAERVEDFLVVLSNRHEISKLFRVCHESRKSAQLFYRVQVPCFYKQHMRRPVEGTFYFNPEWDIVELRPGQRFFAKLADLLKTQDPLGVGLIHVALPPESSRSLPPIDTLFAKNKDKPLLIRAIQNLRTVIIEQVEDHVRGIPLDDVEVPPLMNYIFRSIPLLASVSKFTRLSQDPRAIETELKMVQTGIEDPREEIRRWHENLEQLGVKHERPVSYGYLIAAPTRQVYNQERALDAISLEQKEWDSIKSSISNMPCGNDDESLQTAFGCWVFPFEAFEHRRPHVPIGGGFGNNLDAESGDDEGEGSDDEEGGGGDEEVTALESGTSAGQDEDPVWLNIWDLSNNRPELWLQNLPVSSSLSDPPSAAGSARRYGFF